MRYYEAQREGLGVEFSEHVDEVVEKIRLNPELGAPLSSRVRRRALEVFPYGVIYTLPSDKIRIIAVAHASRRPGYWRSRR
jgi:toxin ParE1/3/4